MKNILVLFSTIFCFVHTQIAQFNYTFVKFVLTWPGTFCQNEECNQQTLNEWDHKSFTVHGLWPSSYDDGFHITFRNGDISCRSPFVSVQNLPDSKKNHLQRIMPGLSTKRSSQQFWQYQFDKHGGCYVNLQKSSGSRYNQKQLMIQYFQTIIKLYDKITSKFKLSSEIYESIQDLARGLRLNQSHFRIKTRQNKLLELSICLSPPKGIEGGLQPIDCLEQESGSESERQDRHVFLPQFKNQFNQHSLSHHIHVYRSSQI